MKAYNAFRTQVEKIKTEKDLKDAHISICRAYSAYRISYEQFMELRKMMIFKRAEKGFSWGKGIKKTAQDTEGKIMTINEAMKKYRLANPTTTENLEMRFSGMDGKTLNFGDKVLLAGYYYNGRNKPCYFGAAYEFLTDDHTCEGMIGLRAASQIEFEDDGHAIAWAMQQ